MGLRRAEVVLVSILAVLAVLVTLVVRAQPPPSESLKAIHFNTEEYVGKRVRLSGTVRVFQDTGAPYYVLEDAQQNRVLLRSDPRALAPLVGKGLTVTGVVGFDDTAGIYLTVQDLAPNR